MVCLCCTILRISSDQTFIHLFESSFVEFFDFKEIFIDIHQFSFKVITLFKYAFFVCWGYMKVSQTNPIKIRNIHFNESSVVLVNRYLQFEKRIYRVLIKHFSNSIFSSWNSYLHMKTSNLIWFNFHSNPFSIWLFKKLLGNIITEFHTCYIFTCSFD